MYSAVSYAPVAEHDDHGHRFQNIVREGDQGESLNEDQKQASESGSNVVPTYSKFCHGKAVRNADYTIDIKSHPGRASLPMVGSKAKVAWSSIGRDRINSSMDLRLSLCASSPREVVLTSSHGRRAGNVRLSPICLTPALVLWMLGMLCFMYALPLLMALAAAALVFLELICKNAGEVMKASCRVSCNGI